MQLTKIIVGNLNTGERKREIGRNITEDKTMILIRQIHIGIETNNNYKMSSMSTIQ